MTMLNSIRGFFANHRYLRSFIIAFVFVAVFAGFMEIRMRSFVASTNKGGPGTWSEFRPHPTLFWRLRPNLDAEISIGDVHFHVKTNSLGLRGKELPFRKKHNEWRAVCLGDSITFGYGVDDGKTYEDDLQELLGELHRDREINIINGGCPGWTSFQARELTQNLLARFNPDLYILGFTYADPAFEDVPDSERVDKILLFRWIRTLLYKSEFYLFLRQKHFQGVNPLGLPPADYSMSVPRISGNEYEENLQWFASLAKANGGHVIYLNLAKRDPDPSELYSTYRTINKDVATSTQNAWLDIDAVFRPNQQSKKLFTDRIHPTAVGYKMMAEAITTEIEKRKWVQK